MDADRCLWGFLKMGAPRECRGVYIYIFTFIGWFRGSRGFLFGIL